MSPNKEAIQKLLDDSRIIFSTLNEEQKEKFNHAFNEIDSDGSGEVSYDELYEAFRGLSSEASDEEISQQVSQLMSDFDVDGNGELNREETFALLAFLQVDPFGCDICQKYLLLDDKFVSCSRCWRFQRTGVNQQCEYHKDGPYIVCISCILSGQKPTEGNLFSVITKSAGVDEKHWSVDTPKEFDSIREELGGLEGSFTDKDKCQIATDTMGGVVEGSCAIM